MIMRLTKSSVVLLIAGLLAVSVLAQSQIAKDGAKSTSGTGALKGKVRVENGTPSGVAVVIRQGEREVTRGLTDKKGEFMIAGLQPGKYGVTLRKTGLSVGTFENVDIYSGKTRSLGGNLFLPIDEGSIAFIRGSVFSQDDRSAPNIRIELGRIEDDGTVKKIDGRVTNEIGAFVFRLSPESAKYRITAKPSGGEPVIKDVEIDGAAVYRLAISLKPATK